MLGLHTNEGSQIPLKSIFADVQIADYTAKVNLTQTYKNEFDDSIEATYNFPITDNSAVTGFTAKINDKIIRAEIKEDEEAKQVYDDSVASGQGAYLLQQTSDDIFTMSVGNLPSGAVVEIEISYICELKGSGEEKSPHVIFTILTTMLQPYGPDQATLPVILARRPKVSYTFDAHVVAKMPCKITKVNCTTHHCNVTHNSDEEFELSVKKTSQHVINKGFIVEVYLKDPHKPRLWSERRPDGSVALMLATYPDISYKQLSTEIIFVIDRSGSMGGEPILQARETLLTCLKMLPETVLFNIIGFGSDYHALFQKSQEARGASLKKAIAHTSKLAANLGGTDILPPLEYIYQQKHIPGTPRNVFVLTDGGVSNMDDVKKSVQKNSDSTRVFSFGIGSGVSESLVNGIARLGKGKAVFTRNITELQGIVSSQVQAALQPALTNVRVTFDGINIAQYAPSNLPPIFNLEQYIVYAFSEPDYKGNLNNVVVTLSAVNPSKKEIKYKLKLTAITNLFTSGEQFIQKLAARSLIQELQEISCLHESDRKDEIKQKIIDLGLTYSLATKHTSFVAVEERDQSTIQQAPMQQVEVPLPVPSGSSLPTRRAGGFAHKIDNSLFKFNSLFASLPNIVTRSQSAKMLTELKSNRKRTCSQECSLSSDLKVSRQSHYDLRDFPFRNVLQTSLDIPLTKSPSSFTDSCITFALKGPVLDSKSFTCWLDASIAFLISIRPLKQSIMSFLNAELQHNSFLNQLATVIEVWCDYDNSERSWRSRLNSEYKTLKDILRTFGFSFSKETSPGEFIQFTLNAVSKITQTTCLLFPSLEDFSQKIPQENIQHVIIENSHHFPGILPKNWKLSSLIHMSNVEYRGGESPFCGHFSMFALDNSPTGYIIYDSMLTLYPGNFQGGYVADTESVYQTVMDEVMDSVVVYSLARV